MQPEIKAVVLTGVKGVFPFTPDNPADDKSRISIRFTTNDQYADQAGLTLWSNNTPEKTLAILEKLGYVGGVESLLDPNSDWEKLFLKVHDVNGVQAKIQSTEHKGKTYWNVVELEGYEVQSNQNKVDKSKFVQSFGFIQPAGSPPAGESPPF